MYRIGFWRWPGLGSAKRSARCRLWKQAFRNREPCMVSLQVDAIFDPLREEDRYKDLVRGVGLEPRSGA
jgi:hypothetical protein